MSKLEPLIILPNAYSSISQLNGNFVKLSDALDNTLSRDGSGPNAMEAVLDMNSNRIINVADPVDNTDAIPKGYGDDNYGGAAAALAVQKAEEAAASAAEALASELAAAESAADALAAEAVLEQERDYVINPRRVEYGAVGDGTTNDYAAFVAAINAVPVGGTLKVTRGTYVIGGTTALLINKSMTVDFEDGAVLKYTDPNTQFFKITGSDVRIIKPTIIGVNPTVRTNFPAIWIQGGAQRVTIDHPRVSDVYGGGILTENCSDIIITSPYVKNTLADGIHITNGSGPSKNVKVISPLVVNTGDDGVSVVSYNTGQAICENVAITDLISIQSSTAGATIAGGRNVRMTGIAITPQGPWGIRYERDSFYNTFGNSECHVQMQVYNADGAGCLIGKSNSDSYFRIMVDGSGITDTNFNRGITLGSVSSTSLVERCTFDFQTTNTASHGIEVNGIKNCNFNSIMVSQAQGHGLVITDNTSNIGIGSIFALNNGLSAPGNLHNINLNNLSGASIGNVISIDDQVTPSVSAALRVNNTTNVSIGNMRMAINGVAQDVTQAGTNTGLQLPGQVLGNFMTKFINFSELNGARAGFFVEQVAKPGGGTYGDGTDDAPGINAAITLASNSAGVNGYCVVKLQAKTYNIATPIQMKKGVYLEGQDWWSTRLVAMAGLTSQVINCNDTNCHNFAIRRLRVDGNRSTATSMTRGIEINRSVAGDEFDTHGIVEEVMIQNCNQEGIYLGVNARECRINNIQARYNRRGMWVEGTDNWFTNNTFNYNDREGILHQGGANHFAVCKAWLNGNDAGGGSKFPNWSFLGYGSSLQQYTSNTTVVGCTSQDGYGDGIYIQYAKGIQISGFTVDRASIIDNSNTTTGSKVYRGVHISDSRSCIMDFFVYERAYQGYSTYTMNCGVRFNRLDQCDIQVRTEDVEVPYVFNNMSTERGNVITVNGRVLDINGVGFNPVPAVGMDLGAQRASGTNVITCNVATPLDDTVPQSTEMVDVVSVSITPTNANSVLRFTARAAGSTNSAQTIIAGIFRDAGASAIAASLSTSTGASGEVATAYVTGAVVAGSTAATTFYFKVGIGDASGGKAFYINGNSSGTRLLGGIARYDIIVEEIKA